MIGRRLSDRYDILSHLGEGGMAVVYKAKDLILDRLVAVKILRHDFSNDEEFIRRFRREAESVASLSHPNIVSIYDIGEEDDCYFIVMEYVQGITLKKFIKSYSPVSFQEVVYIAKQIALALAHAHERGIVHRDIKPHNIIIDENENVKVTDFGIALGVTSATITYTNSILGSAHYISPEQASGGKATIKSDIYAFGIVLFELLTDRIPYPGSSPVTVAIKHLNDPFPYPKDFRHDIPQSLENIVIKSVEKNPNLRYDTMNELYEDLDTALDPNRLNEPRREFHDGISPMESDSTDKEETIKIPPVPRNTETKTEEQNPNEDGNPSKKIKKTKRKRFWLWISLLILMILIGASVAAFYVFPKLFYVQDTTVPDLKGMTYQNAVQHLKEKQLKPIKRHVADNQIDKGKVARQDPESQTEVKVNSDVTIYVSTGAKKEILDNYIGYDRQSVLDLVRDKTYKQIVWKKEYSSTIPEGEVMKQDPSPGKKIIPSETTLELTYSAGEEEQSVPDLTGLSEDDAESKLDQLGLKMEVKDGDYSDNIDKGAVLEQTPQQGESLKKGSSVTVYLSKGKELKPETIKKTIKVELDQNQNDQNQNGQNQSDQNQTEQKPTHVQIIYTDASHNNETFVDEEISETKSYTIPLTIKPNESAHYQVLINGEVKKEETIDYDGG
ncbi:Stk1 family PASTA domain-containing Ser/Thr kinase [Terrilactibacillus sp. BCM23-1]|uniref:Serine/threonine-protein kinase PrkC n=1 Tax=Terrilactibacillus tamarindi TaxID=2599694 RepID=A0A6N8CRQ2_9BACI|nr:Stk1 family PASTA domain-containing Ser/Thr kinase [Terrilactibacillus tamarindi]MTT32318.1 Stk1 family PASTA domain-containing Ser/Thr kinase [Terrilactibacillus tamarindi]